jgi:hypothetical protein
MCLLSLFLLYVIFFQVEDDGYYYRFVLIVFGLYSFLIS